MRYVSAAWRGIRCAAASIVATVPVLARDVMGLAGAASVVFGISQIYVPAAYIAAGLMLIAAALRLACRDRRVQAAGEAE